MEKRIVTPSKRLNKYVAEKNKFASVSAFERSVQKNGTPDYVSISNLLYTMEEYDMAGKTIVYANRRANLNLMVDTENRYERGFGDARVSLQEALSWRNDITYAD